MRALFTHCPAKFGVESGSYAQQVGHVMDILPTCLDLARVEYPDRFNGHNITPLDGKGLTSVLEGGEREGHDRIFFEHVGGKAVLENDWKLVTLRQGLPVGYTTSRTTRGNRLIGRTIILVAQRG